MNKTCEVFKTSQVFLLSQLGLALIDKMIHLMSTGETMTQLPLHGIRVLDLAHLLPGEFATMWLPRSAPM